jgi:hypothetical protein
MGRVTCGKNEFFLNVGSKKSFFIGYHARDVEKSLSEIFSFPFKLVMR